MTEPLYVISRDGHGMGGFLCPPGHWNHEYTLTGYDGGRLKRDPDSLCGIEYALTDEAGASDAIKARVRKIIADATLVDSDMWERSVYGYFRNSYSPEDMNRNVSRAIIDPANTITPDRHLAVLCIREYFPDHKPRLDLIADPGHGYGSYPCAKCDERVQYEARQDSQCVVNTSARSANPVCPKGGKHEI